VRDNVPWYQRSNPWDDGYPFRGYPNNAHRDTYVTTYAADITLNTKIGTWTFTPSYQSGKMYAVTMPIGGAGNAWNANSEINPNRQFELRLASNADSKLSWLTGVFATYNMQPEQYNYGIVFPTSAPATLARPSVGAGSANTSPLVYVLPAAVGGPAALAAGQAYATGQSACYTFNAGYCYTQGGRNSSNVTGSASIYGWCAADQ
jgi:hypothetical protein